MFGRATLSPRDYSLEPPTIGLYDEANEHDGCGVALVARLNGLAIHETVRRALTSLCNLEHRGGEGADAATGDGAGITLQVPDRLFRAVVGFDLPQPGRYGVAVCFLPREARRRAELEQLLVACVEREGQDALGWRDVPVALERIGRVARGSCTGDPAVVHRRGRGGGGHRRAGAKAVCDPSLRGDRLWRGADHPQLLRAHGRLQGHAHGHSGADLLSGPDR